MLEKFRVSNHSIRHPLLFHEASVLTVVCGKLNFPSYGSSSTIHFMVAYGTHRAPQYPLCPGTAVVLRVHGNRTPLAEH